MLRTPSGQPPAACPEPVEGSDARFVRQVLIMTIQTLAPKMKGFAFAATVEQRRFGSYVSVHGWGQPNSLKHAGRSDLHEKPCIVLCAEEKRRVLKRFWVK